MLVYIVCICPYTSFHIFPSHSSPFLPLTTVFSTTARSRWKRHFPSQLTNSLDRSIISRAETEWNCQLYRIHSKTRWHHFFNWHYLFVKPRQTCLWTELCLWFQTYHFVRTLAWVVRGTVGPSCWNRSPGPSQTVKAARVNDAKATIWCIMKGMRHEQNLPMQ